MRIQISCVPQFLQIYLNMQQCFKNMDYEIRMDVAIFFTFKIYFTLRTITFTRSHPAMSSRRNPGKGSFGRCGILCLLILCKFHPELHNAPTWRIRYPSRRKISELNTIFHYKNKYLTMHMLLQLHIYTDL